MNNIQKFFGHLKTILIHKAWVLYYCHKANITWRGLKHDMSKFSPVEFFESIKYYQGNRSPIDAAKEDKGYSAAWMHHKGRNTHHFEYWVDGLDNGCKPLQMPFEDALEMVCDYLAAGRAYMGNKFSFETEYEWWQKRKENDLVIHPQTKLFVDLMMEDLKHYDDCFVLGKRFAKVQYNIACYTLTMKQKNHVIM